MRCNMEGRPSYAMGDLTLGERKQVETKPGVMMTPDSSVVVESNVGGDDFI